MNIQIGDFSEIMSQWAEKVISRIKSNLDTTGTTASGKTRDSLNYEVEGDELQQTLTIYGRQYFQSVEEGRPAGNIPRKFTDILYQWASDKGILANFGDTEDKQRDVLYIIGQSIKHHGTQLYQKGGREDIYTNVFNEELPKLKEEVSVFLTESIAKVL